MLYELGRFKLLFILVPGRLSRLLNACGPKQKNSRRISSHSVSLSIVRRAFQLQTLPPGDTLGKDLLDVDRGFTPLKDGKYHFRLG